MEFLVLFETATVKFIYGGEVIFKGTKSQALKKLRFLHEKYILDICEENVENMLRVAIQKIIDEALVEGDNYDIYEFLSESEIEKTLEAEIPCISVIMKEDIDSDILGFHIIAILLGKGIIFRIILTVTNENKIKFSMEKGEIHFTPI